MNVFYMTALFFVLQLANVIVSTIRSILTIKGTRLQAAIINAIYFSFYTVIVVFIVSDFTSNQILNWIIKISVVFVTNFFGVFISFKITNKARKDKMWEIVAIFSDKNEMSQAISIFDENKVPNYPACSNEKNLNILKIYSSGRKASKEINDVLKKYQVKTIIHEENGIL